MPNSIQESIKDTVRSLRKNQTEAEKVFWEVVRAKRFEGKKFARQYPIIFEYEEKIRFFVADFYCHEKKLVIEIDGKIHEDQKERDEFRTFIINQLDIQVIRFTNEEGLNDLEKVKKELKKFL